MSQSEIEGMKGMVAYKTKSLKQVEDELARRNATTLEKKK